MKKILLCIILFANSIISFAQNDSIKYIYCELIGKQAFFSSKLNVEIDMGENKGFLGINTSYITDEKGKAKKFNSIVDALNLMGENGWVFVQAYVVTEEKNSVYHYLMKQKVVKGKDGKYYPPTKKYFNE